MSRLSLLSEHDFGGNTVQILGALLRNNPAVDLEFVGFAALLDDLKLLELGESPTDDAATGGHVMGSARTDLLGAAVDVSEEGNSSAGPDVDLPGERGDSDVKPVVVERGELLG